MCKKAKNQLDKCCVFAMSFMILGVAVIESYPAILV